MKMLAKETRRIRTFVCGQLRDKPDLSTLTIGILKNRYLAHVQREALSPEAKSFMKQVVQEELMKMQENDITGSELKTKKLQNKRKRQEETDEVISGNEDESVAKKSRQMNSLSESKDKDGKTRDEDSEEEMQIKSGSEDEEQDMNNIQRKKNGKSKRQVYNEDSTDEERSDSEKEGNESPEEVKKTKTGNTKNGITGITNKIQEKKPVQSDGESDSDMANVSKKNDKIKNNHSSDDSDKENPPEEKKNNDPDSDSSSLPSLEDEEDKRKENTQERLKKKSERKEKSNKVGQKVPNTAVFFNISLDLSDYFGVSLHLQKLSDLFISPVEKEKRSRLDENKAVVRLKRYIALCGVRRNYKKLLAGCGSVRSQVAVLKKDLEDLGVHGQPSIEKCKKVKMKREEAMELAELDVSNIITTQGRPARRGREQKEPPSSSYARTLNSGSESDQELKTHRGRRRATDWGNLQGIISDDADSD